MSPTLRIEVRAEAIVTLSAQAFAAVTDGDGLKPEIFVTARIAGLQAAKQTPSLIASALPVALTDAKVEFEMLGNSSAIRIIATLTSDNGALEMPALTAASVAGLALVDLVKGIDDTATIDGVRLVDRSGGERDYRATGPKEPQHRRSASARPSVADRQTRAKPQTLMGEVTTPRPTPDSRREAFRAFMTSHRLRPTTWAKDAGVHQGEILGFLTGRSRGFSVDVAEKLARAAKVRVEDMFQ